MKKILEFLKQKNNTLITAIVLIILILSAIVYFQNKKIVNLNNKYQNEVKLKNALVDTAKTYKNKEGEWVTEKLTLQGSIKSITDANNNLNTSQKDLMKRVKETENNNSIITAALVQTKIRLDSLKSTNVTINNQDSSITFKDSTKDIQYDIEIKNVKPINTNKLPLLMFNKFDLPNKQYIDFYWKDEKKSDFPIAFSVSNSNIYIKTTDINSYAIPQLNKSTPNPSPWQKFTTWMKKSGNFIITIGIAGGAGAGLMLLLHK